MSRRTSKLVPVLLSLLLAVQASGQELELVQKLKGIEILRSSREDIFRLFGSPDDQRNPYYHRYYLSEGTLAVEYSTGLCGRDITRGWNVQEYAVTRLYITFTRQLLPKALGIRPDQFQKIPIRDVPAAASLENEELGIDLTLTAKGTVEDMEFYPKRKYDHLYCDEN